MEITRQKLTVAIICGNAKNQIRNCLNSCNFANEVVVVLANSTDGTKKIIINEFPHVKFCETTDSYNKNFSKWRNLGLKQATGDWLLYLDTDETISDKLANEILDTINKPLTHTYYVIPRQNHFLGQPVHYGDTYPDYVKRLYHIAQFKGYTGILHEEPVIDGTMGYLKNNIMHFAHLYLETMVDKTLAWTDMQALNLYELKHPPMYWWRLPRVFLSKFWQRYFSQKFYKDKTVGLISSIFESFDSFIIYSRLWEIQKNA